MLPLSSPHQPRGLSPPGRRAKNKNAVQGDTLHSVRGETLPMRHRQERITAKTALYKKAGMSYHIPCGAAKRPLCRWCKHLRRLAGVGAPASCRIFVFHVDYSKKISP